MGYPSWCNYMPRHSVFQDDPLQIELPETHNSIKISSAPIGLHVPILVV
jgi:hypothetical protein